MRQFGASQAARQSPVSERLQEPWLSQGNRAMQHVFPTPNDSSITKGQGCTVICQLKAD